jgi:hypothetical protein
MAKSVSKPIQKKSFGTRKKGIAKKKLNKHECKKQYNRQGR